MVHSGSSDYSPVLISLLLDTDRQKSQAIEKLPCKVSHLNLHCDLASVHGFVLSTQASAEVVAKVHSINQMSVNLSSPTALTH